MCFIFLIFLHIQNNYYFVNLSNFIKFFELAFILNSYPYLIKNVSTLLIIYQKQINCLLSKIMKILYQIVKETIIFEDKN